MVGTAVGGYVGYKVNESLVEGYHTTKEKTKSLDNENGCQNSQQFENVGQDLKSNKKSKRGKGKGRGRGRGRGRGQRFEEYTPMSEKQYPFLYRKDDSDDNDDDDDYSYRPRASYSNYGMKSSMYEYN